MRTKARFWGTERSIQVESSPVSSPPVAPLLIPDNLHSASAIIPRFGKEMNAAILLPSSCRRCFPSLLGRSPSYSSGIICDTICHCCHCNWVSFASTIARQCDLARYPVQNLRQTKSHSKHLLVHSLLTEGETGKPPKATSTNAAMSRQSAHLSASEAQWFNLLPATLCSLVTNPPSHQDATVSPKP